MIKNKFDFRFSQQDSSQESSTRKVDVNKVFFSLKFYTNVFHLAQNVLSFHLQVFFIHILNDESVPYFN